MAYVLSFLAGAGVFAAGIFFTVMKENWDKNLTWRGKDRHEGRQS